MPEEVKFDIDATRALVDEIVNDHRPCLNDCFALGRSCTMLRAACIEIETLRKHRSEWDAIAHELNGYTFTLRAERDTLAAEVVRLKEALVDIDKFEPTNLPEVDPYQVIAVYNKRRARAALAPLDAKVAK